jgi:polyisoprenoid-binding protein YceI
VRRLFVAFAFLAACGLASAAEFRVAPGGSNKVTFISRAAMEKFEGTTRKIEGTIVVDPAAPGDSVAVRLEVDLASLDTGIARRNQHMRENHLETAKYPKAIFEGARIVAPAGIALTPDRAVGFDAEGTFTLHGVARRTRVHIEATYRPDPKRPRIDFEATFPVVLSDHQISRPQFLFLKLAETQQVKVNATALLSP